MKARSFFITLALTLLVLLLTALGLGWAIGRHSPLKFGDQQKMNLPRAAQFVPRQAALSVHWFMDPSTLPNYAEAAAPTRKRKNARNGTKQIRDGVFALAGLDFDTELADWLGPQMSFSLFGPEGPNGPLGWVLALTSRDEKGAKRFLQRFWQTRSLAGTNLQISSYRGMGLINGRNNFIGNSRQSISTALIDDDLLLLASGRGVLEQALDVSQLSAKHQLGDEELLQGIEQLEDGVALLTASPSTLHSWLGLPLPLSQRDDLKDFIGTFHPEDADLLLDGLLRFKQPFSESPIEPAEDFSLLNTAGGAAEGLALLNSPARLLDQTDQDPIVQWIGPSLRLQLSKAKTSASKTIAVLDDGPLLWLQQPEGWVLSTQKQHPTVTAVSEVLQQEGLMKSDLESENETLQIWSRLIAQQKGSNDKLDTRLAVVLEEEPLQSWWGETLAALKQRKAINSLQPRLKQLQGIAKRDGNSLAQQMALGSTQSQEQLKQWRPWTLLQTIAGPSLESNVQGLAIAVGPDKDEKNSFLRLRARISLG